MKLQSSLVGYFDERLERLRVSRECRAYVVGVLNDMKNAEQHDMSRQSMTLAYFDAVQTRDFEGFQRLGDWVLFAEIIVPKSIKERELVLTLARKSYTQCGLIMQGAWVVYDELAARIESIGPEARGLLAVVDVGL